LVFQYVGEVALTPDVDEWKDITRRPDLIVNDNALFDSMTALAGNTNNLGTMWNEWQTNWTGRWDNFQRQGNFVTGATGRLGTRTRTGISREIAGSNVRRQSFGERIVDLSFIPFIRSRDVSFSGTRLKPNTKVFPFFDNVDVSAHVTPTSGVLGGQLTTDANGAVSGTFTIPNTATTRFRAGERIFRLTSSSTNSSTDNDVDTFADGRYTARGLQFTTEETIQSTRVPIIRSRTVTDREPVRTTDQQGTFFDPIRNQDPVAQTFKIDQKEGVFLSKVDLFFSEKDDNIPIKVYLVETINSRPGQKILPFS
jgi:hypothetical protein